MLWEVGILRDEYESSELSWGPSQPGKCCCSKQCHQLVWNLLCHTTDWSLSSRFIFGKILDNCEFCYHIYHCKFALKVNQISSTLDQCLWLSVCIESSLVSVYACLFISSHSRISSAKSLSWFSPFQDIL